MRMSNGAGSQEGSRVAAVLLLVATALLVTTLGLAYATYRLATRQTRLEDLSADERLLLVERAEKIAPAVYQPFPGTGDPGFYHMKPDTRYDREHPAAGPAGVLGDEFTTNDLGFRTHPTEKPPGTRRLLVIGDSWTFGPGVKESETFTRRLEDLLTEHASGEGKEPWQVYNMGIMGWNTDNELTALRVLFEKVKPDLIVICPTSNDIDSSFDVWKDRLINRGFQSAAIFIDSYEYERRWVDVFRRLDETEAFLASHGVPMLGFFLAEWRGLGPYYAAIADADFSYSVIPTEYIEAPYRLTFEVDAGRHANAAGHLAIATHLYNTLVAGGFVAGDSPLPDPHPVVFPGQRYVAADAEREFAMWRSFKSSGDLIALNEEYMGRAALFNVPADSDARTVAVTFELAPLAGLYPLEVEVELLSPEGVRETRVFAAYAPGEQRVELVKPPSLDRYASVEVALRFNRVAVPLWSFTPVSLARPKIELY